MKTDIQIARECELKPISEIATELGIDPEQIEPYGRYMAKVPIISAKQSYSPSTQNEHTDSCRILYATI